MTLEGQSVTVVHQALPQMKQGIEAIVLLTRKGTKYYIAGDYLGAFAVQDAEVVPLTEHRAFASSQRGKSVATFLPDVVARLRAVRPE
jgi:hypothetical protein